MAPRLMNTRVLLSKLLFYLVCEVLGGKSCRFYSIGADSGGKCREKHIFHVPRFTF